MALGEIRMFCGNYAPETYAFCDGSLLEIAKHRELFDRIGTRYGGDGRTNFALPDLRGRAPMHRADGAALGTKGTIPVETARPKASHARLALNFIFGIRHHEWDDREAYLGEVRPFACNYAPQRWARCEGQLLPIMQNTALFSILNKAYGGDGSRTFAIPDLRQAFSFGPATPDERGKTGGAWPRDEGSSPQTPLLVVTYCIAIEGLYPGREG